MASWVFLCLCGISAIAASATCPADRSDTTCADITASEVVQGSALLQVKKTPAANTISLAVVNDESKHQAIRTCSVVADPYTAPLDASGFLMVTSTCCAWKMEAFFIRLLESMGYFVCSMPHLQGLMHWFTCVPDMDFNYILNIIENGNEFGCKFWSKIGEECPAIEGTHCDNPSQCTSGADPFAVSLDAAGFLGVTSTCCAWKTEAFFNNLLETMGYKVCSKPHVQGLMHWLTCVPDMDFQYVITLIEDGNEHGCKFWSKTDEECPQIAGTPCDNPCKPDVTTLPPTEETPWPTPAPPEETPMPTPAPPEETPMPEEIWTPAPTEETTMEATTTLATTTTKKKTTTTKTTTTRTTTTLATTTTTPKPTTTTSKTTTTTTPTTTTTTTSKTTTTTTPTTTTTTTTTTTATTTTTTTPTITTTTTATTGTTTTLPNVTCCMEFEQKGGPSGTWTIPQVLVDARAAYAQAAGSALIATKATRVRALSAVTPWDCDATDGPVQVLTDTATGPFTNVSQLNVLTGEYDLLFQIPTNITEPEMTKFINSAAINPVDGIAYATVPIGDDYYMVRFDEDTFEFVAKLPASGDITGNYDKNHYFVGAFGWDGTYYIGAEGNLLAIQDVALMQGYESQTDSSLTQVTTQTSSSFSLPGFYADVIIGMGDFDNSGTTSQWIFGLSGNSMLTLGKLPQDPGNVTSIQYYQLSASNPLDNPGGSAASFGAAWNYQDLIFFARNNGDGIFEVMTDTIDLTALTYDLQFSGSSAPTNKNDGLGCMDAENPWFCNAWEQAFNASGSCPDGTRPVAYESRTQARDWWSLLSAAVRVVPWFGA